MSRKGVWEVKFGCCSGEERAQPFRRLGGGGGRF